MWLLDWVSYDILGHMTTNRGHAQPKYIICFLNLLVISFNLIYHNAFFIEEYKYLIFCLLCNILGHMTTNRGHAQPKYIICFLNLLVISFNLIYHNAFFIEEYKYLIFCLLCNILGHMTALSYLTHLVITHFWNLHMISFNLIYDNLCPSVWYQITIFLGPGTWTRLPVQFPDYHKVIHTAYLILNNCVNNLQHICSMVSISFSSLLVSQSHQAVSD